MYLSDVFFLTICENINQAENEHKECYYSKAVNFLLKATIRGLLVESPKVLSVPRMRKGFSFSYLKFVVARSNCSRYQVGPFPVRS